MPAPYRAVGHHQTVRTLSHQQGTTRQQYATAEAGPTPWLEAVAAHDRTGHQHEREPPPRIPVPPHLKPPPAAQPRQRPLHLPAVAPSRADDSIPRRAIGGRIPRRRSQARLAWLSYPLSAWTLSGRARRRPDGVRTGGMSSTTACSMVTSETLAAVTTTVSTLTRDQSSWACPPSRSKTARCRASNTPAAAHSVSRRQQVEGEPQPSSRAGSSRHGSRCGP